MHTYTFARKHTVKLFSHQHTSVFAMYKIPPKNYLAQLNITLTLSKNDSNTQANARTGTHTHSKSFVFKSRVIKTFESVIHFS